LRGPQNRRARRLGALGALAAAALLLGAATGWCADVVCTRQLLLLNRLQEARPDELIAVSLDELNVSPEDERRIRDVQVLDAEGREVLSQYDAFCEEDGFRGEVALLVDLRPGESRAVEIRFLDGPRPASGKKVVQVRAQGDAAVEVTTPGFKALVAREGGSLCFRRVVITKGEKEAEEDMMEGLLDVDDGPVEGGKKSPRGGDLLGDSSVPFQDGGLPFAFHGMQVFGPQVQMKVYTGRVRAAVTLFDRSPWRTAKLVIPCRARQTLSVPVRGRACYLKCLVLPQEPVPDGRVSLGGIRVASTDHVWDLKMGQKGKPPQVAPVKITLAGKGRVPYLEPYQKATFNHQTARLACDAGWAGVALDRGAQGFGPGYMIGFSDPGPYRTSVQPLSRVKGLPAQSQNVARAAFFFGADEKPGDMDALGRRVNSRAYVPHLAAVAAQPPSEQRLRELVRECDVVVVAPGAGGDDTAAQCERLAAALQGTVQAQDAFAVYLDWYASGYADVVKRFPPLLVVLAGQPGEHTLLDRFNDERRLFNRYPLSDERAEMRLVDNPQPPQHVLLLCGSTQKATAAAVQRLIKAVGQTKELLPLSVTPCAWADRMPFAWMGLKGRGDSSRATAFRNGHAEHLFLLRANRKLAGLRIKGAEKLRARSVSWHYGSDKNGSQVASPVHDAAFPALPETLEAGRQLGLWLSLQVPADAVVGVRKDLVTLHFDGGSRQLTLETKVLAPVLADRPPIGFCAMGANKFHLKKYLGWQDDEAYCRCLPGVLAQLGAFGVSYYGLDAGGLKVRVDAEGDVTVDAAELKKEFDAACAAGVVDVMEVSSLNHLLYRAGRQVAARKGLLDEYEAWHAVIAPAIREKLREEQMAGRLCCRHADEIGDYERWLPNARAFRAAGFRMTVAINGYGVYNKHLAVGTMDMWMPLFNFYLNRWGRDVPPDAPLIFNRDFRDARLAAGDKIWPYVCGPGPYAYGPRPRSRGRFLLLDAYMKGAHGVAYYGGLQWSHALDPAYRKTQLAPLFKKDCTFVSLFYPDRANGTVVPSLRMGAIRMGQEDAAGVEALRRLARQKGQEEEVEAKISAAYAEIQMDAPEETFAGFREAMAGLYQALKAD